MEMLAPPVPDRSFYREVAAAALIAQLFTLYLLLLHALSPPSASNWDRADPILLIIPRAPSMWLVPALAVVVAAVWVRIGRPAGATLWRSAAYAALGAVVAVAVAGTIRLTAGPNLPSFIPAEESAGPGFLLSMTAGYGEEVLFRLALLPIAYVALAPRIGRFPAALLSALAIGVAFALLHAAGPGPFVAATFATRLLFPGIVMSLAFLFISPSFLVAAHCTAHLLIPVLFV